MRPTYDEFEEYDYSDSPAVSRLLREQRREEGRFAQRRSHWRGKTDHLDARDLDDWQPERPY